MNIKMLKDLDDYKKNEVLEIDDETGQKWVAAGLCETVENPIDKVVAKLQDQVDSKINAAVEKLADSIATTVEPKINVLEEKKSLGDFVQSLEQKNYDKLTNKYGLVVGKTLNTSDDSAVVPTPLAEELFKSDGYEQSIWSHLKVVPMDSTTLKLPVLNQAGTSPSGSTSQSCFGGGVYGTFVSEDADAVEHEPAFVNLTLTAARYTSYTKLTPEIRMTNVVDLENFLVGEFGRAFLRDMDYYTIHGSGSTQPTGILDHAGTVEIGRNTASTVKYVDLVNMIAHYVGMNDGFWICHPTCLAQIMQLQDGAGNAVWQPSAQAPITGGLFGMPLVISEMAATLGSDGDVFLVNKNAIAAGQLRDVTISISDYVDFLTGRRTYRVDSWVDAKPLHAGTFLLNDGSTEVSGIIQLGAGS